jgi:hypothetical protein
MSEPIRPDGPRCSRCGSGRLRRSSAHNRVEHWVRRATPIHFYSCGDCGRRSWLWRPHPHAPEQPAQRAPRRRIEGRDARMRMRERRHVIWTVGLAVALGAAAGVYLERCASSTATESNSD